jgi:hypothetical protein
MSLRFLNLTSIYQVVAVALTSLVTFVAWPAGALSVLFGGGFGAMNFYALRGMGERALSANDHRLAWVLALGLKLVTTLGVMAALVFVLELDVLGFALGLATLFVGLLAALSHITLAARIAARG